jgi:dTDP-4-amino-4,6-dideoxygalactose transaminase
VLSDEAEAREVETLRFHGITRLPDGTRDVAFPGGKFNLPDVNARIGLGQLSATGRVQRRRRELSGRLFPTVAHRSALPVAASRYPGDEAGHSWNLFAPLLPLDRLRIDRKQFRARLESAASAPACPTRRRISPRCSVAEAIARESCRIPSGSPAKP